MHTLSSVFDLDVLFLLARVFAFLECAYDGFFFFSALTFFL